ncbi:hypothetical protein [Piscirickettsia litoralis]|uniref:Uncharacterized protein n=1 Tax=Piscirickettsia litoralis TaxID=1891921 RepID=A0ABX3A0A3_9GAMM|nr:hypothetical protein [Piscirickettsia litoralis]ODN41692.1 hypothetical protein BGC07_00215 [Piscirickettsia litoralis]
MPGRGSRQGEETAATSLLGGGNDIESGLSHRATGSFDIQSGGGRGRDLEAGDDRFFAYYGRR